MARALHSKAYNYSLLIAHIFIFNLLACEKESSSSQAGSDNIFTTPYQKIVRLKTDTWRFGGMLSADDSIFTIGSVPLAGFKTMDSVIIQSANGNRVRLVDWNDLDYNATGYSYSVHFRTSDLWWIQKDKLRPALTDSAFFYYHFE